MKYPTYEIDEQLVEKGYKYIVGVDEVGRGPGAGPVVACGVYMPVEHVSKFLTRGMGVEAAPWAAARGGKP